VPIYERAGSVTPPMQWRLVNDVLGQLAESEVPDEMPEQERREHQPADRRPLAERHLVGVDASFRSASEARVVSAAALPAMP
jgi:hypothetical protein